MSSSLPTSPSLPANDIVIRIRPDREMRSTPQIERTYQALFYTLLPLAGPLEVSGAENWKGLSVCAAGRMKILWQDYQTMLADLFDGIRGVEKLSQRMRDCFSSSMQILLDQIAMTSGTRRIWWGSDAPELDDMPWELLFTKPFMNQMTPNFVRGLPPESPLPILPLKGPLRLFWNNSAYTPGWVRSLFRPGNLPGIETTEITGGLREALRTAARQGAELFHCCADGVVSLAYEGALYDHNAGEEISPSEVADVVRGTRLSLIGFTPQEPMQNADVVEISGREVVSVYRAFACFSSARFPIPSVIVPLGPFPGEGPQKFWKVLYQELGQSYHLDAALLQSRMAAGASPFAVFMRHGQSKLFRPAGQRAYETEPEQVASSLGSSAGALQRIQALQSQFGSLPDYLTSFAEDEGKRVGKLGAELADWSRLEEGEE
jgi:hypothetical protein